VSGLGFFACYRFRLLLSLRPTRTHQTPSQERSKYEQIHPDDESYREFGWAHGYLLASLPLLDLAQKARKSPHGLCAAFSLKTTKVYKFNYCGVVSNRTG
jgi:hypothetical protein